MKAHWLIAGLLGSAARAHADPDPAALASAPPPGAESGRVDAQSDSDSVVRTTARVVLWVPRMALEVVFLPVRGALYLNDEYRFLQRARHFFFNKEGTIGLYPIALFESTQGVMLGAKFVAGLTSGNKIEVFGGAGLYGRRRADLLFRSTGHFGNHLGFWMHAEYDDRPRDRFYGVGNADESPTPAMPISAFNDVIAPKSYYDDTLFRGAAVVDLRVIDSFHLAPAGAIWRRDRDASSKEPSIEQVFEPRTLISFDEYDAGYGELAARYDSRGPSDEWQPRTLFGQGSLAEVYGGMTWLDPGPSFWRYGFDAQHYITIGTGPRVISARVQGEAVTAHRDEIPFTELPALGGRNNLRGYPLDRFRDRVAAVGTLEYQFDLSRRVYASVFTDVGRVYPSLDDLSLDDMRWGYGLALEAHSYASFVARASIASSIDGGVFLNFYLDPVTAIQPRVRRR